MSPTITFKYGRSNNAILKDGSQTPRVDRDGAGNDLLHLRSRRELDRHGYIEYDPEYRRLHPTASTSGRGYLALMPLQTLTTSMKIQAHSTAPKTKTAIITTARSVVCTMPPTAATLGSTSARPGRRTAASVSHHPAPLLQCRGFRNRRGPACSHSRAPHWISYGTFRMHFVVPVAVRWTAIRIGYADWAELARAKLGWLCRYVPAFEYNALLRVR